jgi:hypothetical protein
MSAGNVLAEELSQIISQATAPAFLLGAMAGLVSVLIGRLNRIIDRTNALTAVRDEDPARGHLRMDIPRLERRAKLVNKAIEFAVISGIFTTLLVLIAFASAFVGVGHAYAAALLFMLAVGSFGISLIYLWAEVRISLSQFDFYG